MKHLLTILILFISSSLFGQLILTPNDTIPVTKDTITLKVGKYRGNLFWQQSLDNKNWVTLKVGNSDSLNIKSDTEAYFRAEIIEGRCNPIYSDEIKLEIDSFENDINSSIEIAYPDSTGEIVSFVVGNDTIKCTKINNEYVFQGDIILTREQLHIDSLKSASKLEIKLWPDNTIYYKIEENVAQRELVKDAIKHWEDNTPLKFVEYINQKNKIIFRRDEVSTSSPMGMTDGGNVIKLDKNQPLGGIIHEIGHSVGLIHEQSRSDRDKYITVNTNNIWPKYAHNFDIIDNSINVGAFDFSSIMLYPCYISPWAIKNSIPLIQKKDGSLYGHQYSHLSPGDIAVVKYLYPIKPATVLTTQPSNITSNSASCGGMIINNGGSDIISYGFCWGKTNDLTDANNIILGRSETHSFVYELNGLAANTTYYVWAWATNVVDKKYGNQEIFTTGQTATPPTVVTNSATAIAQTTANLGGNISSDGGATVTERGFYLGTSQDMTTAIKKTADIAGIGSFSSNLTGLKANTAYYVWAYAINSAGIAYGNQISFTTAGPIITSPTVTTTPVADITPTSATSGGNITSDGGAVVTERGVCWSTTQDPTKATQIPASGSGTGSFTCNISGLTANTTYYVWAYATNSTGTGYGNMETFTTSTAGNLTGTFTDSRDGKIYKWVQIGSQTWMAENLAYLPSVSPGWGNSYHVSGYNGTNVGEAKALANYSKYGVLYEWGKAMASCPAGWHIPSDEEWKQLEMTLGMTQVAADATGMRGTDQALQMKATTGWNNNGNGTNSSNFSALPGGYCSYTGTYSVVGISAHWYSSTKDDYPWIRSISGQNSKVERSTGALSKYSVRCIKD